MCSPEEGALLRQEEVFSTTLARINTLVLQPLLLTTPEPSDPRDRECLRLLQQLHRSSQQLWEVTEESLHSLRERLRHPDSVGLESLLLLRNADHVLQVHMEYFESYTSCVVVQAFQKAAKRRSEYWRGQRKTLWQLLSGMGSEGSMGTALVQVLRQPLAHHLQQYVLLLLSLGDTIGEHHPARELVVHAATLFGNLQSFMRQALDQAVATQALWHTLGSRLRDMLCIPAHRLLQDSKDIPVTVAPLRAERVLLFDDALVLLQGHNVHTFDLKLLWVDPGQDEYTFHLLTPEEEFSFCTKDPQSQAVWQWKVTQAVCQALRGKKDFPVLGAGLELPEPPACRCGAYTFRGEGRLCQATYEGEWCQGRPHGKGTLKWPDGRNHVGNFCQGLEHGFGIHLVPQVCEDKFDCYKCHWWEGSMCGYGICTAPMRYTRATSRQACGTDLGSWRAPHRPPSPAGTQATGSRARGAATVSRRTEIGASAMSACGRLTSGMAPGSWSHRRVSATRAPSRRTRWWAQGSSSLKMTPCTKGKITFPNGFTLEGSFDSGTGSGLHTQGVLDTGALPPDPSSTCKRQLGLGAFPVESRWQGVYGPFRDFVRAGCPGDLQEALLGFHVQSSKVLRKSQEYLCCERTHPEDGTGSIEDILEEVLRHREPKALQQYLGKALSNSLHPLGKLLRTLMLTFQATYAGVGANKHLQGMAQEEVKQHARELWVAYRGLLQVALQRKGQTLEDEDVETRDLQVHGLVLPLVLPSFHSELFTLYLLLHEREDSLYSQGITNLSLFPDTKLLEFLEVQKHLWPLKDLTLTTNQRYSLVRDKCFLSATECLQKIITTMDPREKLEVLEKTYGEIEATVSRVLGREHKLPMDDLLPLLIYVAARARIQHLGAEIHLIRDMMDPIHTGGLYDFLLTALESCYEHIQKEDMRLHRFPGCWEPREAW
ncbi:ALS2 C-terminal-like protein isoform X2 [Choloepus didactylus]|uniref:ALS2 C-terminal-like protein isoform X2 n=1 Tax=Choloepus didactylus TaxID=27675 RepID=UPI00189FBFAA|nr:ALS2 C-terminal-like protein isoform X2 [Choloepus didactylus]